MKRPILYTLIFSICLASISLASSDILPPVNEDHAYEYYLDEEEKVIYIDFESVEVNIQFVVVKNHRGKMILKEDVSKLPVNCLYELDYSKLKEGDYTVEVHTRSKVLSRELHFE